MDKNARTKWLVMVISLRVLAVPVHNIECTMVAMFRRWTYDVFNVQSTVQCAIHL